MRHVFQKTYVNKFQGIYMCVCVCIYIYQALSIQKMVYNLGNLKVKARMLQHPKFQYLQELFKSLT